MIYFIILILLAIIVEVLYDAKYGDDHGRRSNIILGVIMLSMEGFGFWLANTNNGLIYYVGFRVVLFDYMFSYRKHKHIWHLGDNTIDTFTKRFNKWVVLGFRIVLLVGVVYKLILITKGA